MARVLEEIVASLDDNIKEAIFNYSTGNNPEDVKYLSGEWAEGIILVHTLEALRFCRRVCDDVNVAIVATKLNENPCFFFSKNSTAGGSYADGELWQFGCLTCHPVVG
ncbi:MAG: hypothetical protein Q7T51_04510 [Candidatus Moranbacteria bacterium]|nr:hypothetical protein [Candidatus Moranbacteria bacterium]